ncbi:hypothetical protein K439DRAFT_1505951 [Ramaria rubella]|nr:hypothetical protein K439DRAFT_1505951 [Ramaria rubella]
MTVKLNTDPVIQQFTHKLIECYTQDEGQALVDQLVVSTVALESEYWKHAWLSQAKSSACLPQGSMATCLHHPPLLPDSSPGSCTPDRLTVSMVEIATAFPHPWIKNSNWDLRTLRGCGDELEGYAGADGGAQVPTPEHRTLPQDLTASRQGLSMLAGSWEHSDYTFKPARPFPLPTPPESISDADTDNDHAIPTTSPSSPSSLWLPLAPQPTLSRPSFPHRRRAPNAGIHTAIGSLHAEYEKKHFPAVSPNTATGAASLPQRRTSEEIALYRWIKTHDSQRPDGSSWYYTYSNQPHGSFQLKPTRQACYSLDGCYAAVEALSKAESQYQP